MRFSPSLPISSCSSVYESLISKAVNKVGSGLGKKKRGTKERNFVWILPYNRICLGAFVPLLTLPSFQESYLLFSFAGCVS